MATATKLKYLFTVVYVDGSKFEQEPEDVSRVDPKRSAYFDVDQEKILAFYLRDAEEGWYVAQLNLHDGKFFVNDGIGFTLDKPGPKPYKLIFNRQHTHTFNMGLEEIDHTIKYCIGYTDADGKEHMIMVD